MKFETYDSLYNEAKEIESHRRDYIVEDPASNLRMSDSKLVFNAGRKSMKVPMTSWALSQLSAKVGVPSTYAERCIEADMAWLAAENINNWLRKTGENRRPFLVRTYKDEADAVLSSSYSTFDSTKVMEVVEQAVKVGDYRLKSAVLDHERMHFRLIGEDLKIPGEDLFAGLFVDSSDVGRTAISVSFGIWKQVCSNGLCVPQIGGVLYRQRHIGVSPDGILEQLTARMSEIPRLEKEYSEIVGRAAKERFDLRNEEVVQSLVREIRRAAAVEETQAKGILTFAEERYDDSRWGIVNAMTELAQQGQIDYRLRMERAAATLIMGK